jgi:predicted AAA+ superfamily ATPase
MDAEFALIRDDLLLLQAAFERWECVRPALEEASRYNRKEAKEFWNEVKALYPGDPFIKEILKKVKTREALIRCRVQPKTLV